jgi:hypothetical protein
MKKPFVSLLIFFFTFIRPQNLRAYSDVVSSSATLKIDSSIRSDFDYRANTLKTFLTQYNSPLADYSACFVKNADKYHLDWRLVAAISGVESTFGKRIPYNSYNAYGWANGDHRFTSWEESISSVSKALREKYYDKGTTTIQKIAHRYAPPSSTWAGKVKYFMNEIDPTPVEFDL